MRKFLFLFVVILGFFVGLALRAQAQSATVAVPEADVVAGNFVRLAQSIDVKGIVKGDMIVAGQTVILSGTVEGDLIAAAETVQIFGEVKGDVRVAARSVYFGNRVGHNVTVFAETVTIADPAIIEGHVYSAAKDVRLEGAVNGTLEASAQDIEIDGRLVGSAKLRTNTKGRIRFGSEARLGGDVEYWSETPVVDKNAEVKGQVIQRGGPIAERSWEPGFFRSLFGWWVGILSSLLVGWILVRWFRRPLVTVLSVMKEKSFRTIGWGFLAMVLTPVVLILLAVTLIGFPIAIIGVALYGSMIYLSSVVFGIMVGTFALGLLHREDREKVQEPTLWAVLLGIVLARLLFYIPVAGSVIASFGWLWTFGAMAIALRRGFLSVKSDRH